jgi:poly-gamma-glutamate synthesis protein (capsule biosynthesis protein)
VSDWVAGYARACIDAGAGAFVSHGLPLIRPIEIYRNRPIFYGLANFIFQTMNATRWLERAGPWAWRSLTATAHFDSSGAMEHLELRPIVVGDPLGEIPMPDLPRLAQGVVADEILDRLAELCLDVGTRIEVRDGSGTISKASDRSLA